MYAWKKVKFSLESNNFISLLIEKDDKRCNILENMTSLLKKNCFIRYYRLFFYSQIININEFSCKGTETR